MLEDCATCVLHSNFIMFFGYIGAITASKNDLFDAHRVRKAVVVFFK